MLQSLARNWWALALRGVLAILFGVAAFVWPGMTIAALVLLFGAYAFVDGLFALMAAIRQHGDVGSERWWMLLLEGLAGIGVGVLTVLWPNITGLVLLYLIAAWAIITGVFEILAAIRLRREIDNEWWLALAGIASVVFGVLIALQPAAGALAIVWILGGYAILFGILLLALAFRLRGMGRVPENTLTGV